jgi:hypothetical protein
MRMSPQNRGANTRKVRRWLLIQADTVVSYVRKM